MEGTKIAASMRDITKTFGSVVANDKVCMDISRGEILALLGENGSGKTTLMNILSGIYFPDSGQIMIDGKEVTLRSPKDAFDLGVGMIHQHFKLVDVLTVAENVILGMPGKGKLNLKDVSGKISKICKLYGFQVDPEKKIYDLSVSEKQTVEIIKVLYRGADILILDEPTAVLTPQKTSKLFNVLRNMKKDNKAIIIITHKLHEVEEISDRVEVLRKGQYVGSLVTAESNAQEMTDMMVGRSVSLNIHRPEPIDPQPRIVVKGLNVVDKDGVAKLKNVSFTANSGEILGIAGISGSGQKELLEALAGIQPLASGDMVVMEPETQNEVHLTDMSPRQIANLGVTLSFVPEDRLGMGLVANMDLTDNMMLRSFRKGKSIFTDRKSPKNLAERVVDDLEVKTPGLATPVRRLSGGNVQKILVGREISTTPTVLMTAYAVRGLDINASYTIYDLVNQQKAKGVAVIFVGEDLDVLLELSDRIMVLCDGQVSGIVPGRGADKNEVGLLMTRLSEVRS